MTSTAPVNDRSAHAPRFLEVLLAQAELVFGVLLSGLGGLVSITFLYRWDGHVGAPIAFIALGTTVLGLVLLLGGVALHKRWPARWVWQLPVAVLLLCLVFVFL